MHNHNVRMSRRLLPAAPMILMAALILLVLALLPGGPARSQALRAQDDLRYTSIYVMIDVQEDGSFTVRSTQTVQFDDAYSTAFTEIPTDRAAGVRDVAVYEQEEDGTLTPLDFTLSDGEAQQYVDWEFAESSAGESRTFVIDYTIAGGLWVYQDQDILRWFAVNADRSGLPVEQATVAVSLPAGAEGAVTSEAIAGNATTNTQGRMALFQTTGPLADGEGLEIEVGFPHGLTEAVVQPWQEAEDAAELAVEIPYSEVTLAVGGDGRLAVTEETQVAVQRGVVDNGFRSLALVYMDGISGVQLAQDGRPLAQGELGCSDCFVVRELPASGPWAQYDADSGELVIDEDAAGRVEIEWFGAQVDAGETTRLTIGYVVEGGVRTGEDAQVIHAEVLPDYDTTTGSAMLRLVPPPGVAADALTVESGAAMAEPVQQPDGSLLYRNLDLPAERARWEVVVTMPPGATSATTPAWQAAFEEAVAAQAAAVTAAARRTLTERVGGVLAGVVALAGGVWVWFRFGRKQTRGLLQGYVAEPPSDLAPGIVAYLMDRNASERGVLASLFHLATAGLVEMDLQEGVALRRLGLEPVKAESRFKTSDGGTLQLARHQVMLFNEMVLPHVPADRAVALDDLAGPLRAKLPALFALMGEDAQSYFLAGSRGGAPGCLTPMNLIGLAAVAFAALLFFGGLPSWSTLFAIAGFVFAAVMLFLALGQPFGRRRSDSGEAEAAKWARFRNYLLNLKEYGDQAAAQEIMDRYFAYAVALGAEEVVLKQASDLGAQMPPWMALPMSGPRPQGTQWPSSTQPTNTGSGGATLSLPPAGASTPVNTVPATAATGPRPSLSSVSAGMGTSLSGASKRMGTTLAAAAGATAATVVLKSQARERAMQWEAGTQPTQMLDDIMRQSLRDAEQVRSQPAARGPRSPGWGGPGLGGGGSSSSWGRGGSRSTGGFGSSSSRSSSSRSSGSSSRSSSSRSSSSSSRSSSSSGGGRSGFGKR